FDCVIGHYRYPIPWKFVAGFTRESKTKRGCGLVLFGSSRLFTLWCGFNLFCSFNSCFVSRSSSLVCALGLASFQEFAFPFSHWFGCCTGFAFAFIASHQAVSNSISDNAGEQGNGANSVVVTWNWIGNFIWISIGVKDRNYWNAQFVSFIDSQVFFFGVNDPDC